MFSLLLGVHPGLELRVDVVTLCFTNVGGRGWLPNCSPQRRNHVPSPPAVHEGFNFSAASSTLVVFHVFRYHGRPSECGVVSHGSLTCISLQADGAKTFPCVLGRLTHFHVNSDAAVPS